MQKREDQIKTANLTVEWYNKNPQLYRTYLQSLFLRLEKNSNSSTRQHQLIETIKRYLSAQKQLQQAISQKSKNITAITSQEDTIAKFEQLNKQIDAYEKSIYQIKHQIQVKIQEQQIFRRILIMQLQNFKKAYISFLQTIDHESRVEPEVSLSGRDFFGVDVGDVDKDTGKNVWKLIKDAATSRNQQIKSDQTQLFLIVLEAKKAQAIAEISHLIENELFQIQIQRLYTQKEETLKQLKATQQSLQDTEKIIQEQEIVYKHNLAQRKVLQQEINRIKLRINDIWDLTLDANQYQFQPLPEEQTVHPFESKLNKKFILQNQDPKAVHYALSVWAILLVISFILINIGLI